MENDYLSHYGVMGQKWGERHYQTSDGTWTEEGLARRRVGGMSEKEQRKFAKKYAKDINNARSNGTRTILNEEVRKVRENMLNNSNIIEIQNKLQAHKNEFDRCENKVDQLMKDYDALNYSAIAGIATDILYYPNFNSMGSLGNAIWFYVNEDGDQGRINSRSVYAQDKGITEQVHELASQFNTAYNNLRSDSKKMVDELLGAYADTPIKHDTYSSDDTVSKDIARLISYSVSRANPVYKQYIIDDADELAKPTEKELEAISTAKSIVSKMNLNEGNAYYIMDAMEEAGIADKDFRDMTDADWKKLNDRLQHY